MRSEALEYLCNNLTVTREQTAFINPARTDGLVLKHWRKRKTTAVTTPGAPNTPADLKVEQDTDTASTQTETDYHFAKFNIKVKVPEYNDEQYQTHLKNGDWSKEETDYLIELARDFDLKWIVMADRYEYKSKGASSSDDAMAVMVNHKPRTMEEMKARYYDVAAKVMVLHQPLDNMSAAEFELHEKMDKFDPVKEATRKKLAEALLSRSPEEIKEEEILLGELKRIVVNEERFAQERKELYDRLQTPISTTSIANFESSQGLATLMQQLLSIDKNKKQRRALTGPGDGTSSPAVGPSGQILSGPGGRDQRNSIGGSSVKKGSLSGPSSQRQLTPREEAKYGVAHHERLTSGVSLRGYRIEKLLQAKSQAQSKKLDDVLRELQVPHKAVMPTNKVCNAYEELVVKINIMLDVRKVSEKVENEIKVLQAQKEYREKKESGEDATTPQASSPAAEELEAEAEAEDDNKAEIELDEEEDAEGEEDEADVEMEDAAKETDEEVDVDNDEEDDNENENENEDEEEDDEMEEEGIVDVDEENNNENAGDDGDGDDDGEEDELAEDDTTDNAKAAIVLSDHRSASVLSVTSQKSSRRQKK